MAQDRAYDNNTAAMIAALNAVSTPGMLVTCPHKIIIYGLIRQFFALFVTGVAYTPMPQAECIVILSLFSGSEIVLIKASRLQFGGSHLHVINESIAQQYAKLYCYSKAVDSLFVQEILRL